MKICQQGMIYRKMAHLPPLIVMTKQNIQYLTRKETRYASSMLIIKKNAPVHEYVYPNHVSYIEVLPNFTSRDRLIDSALGSLNIAIIPIVLSISMICCVTFFIKKIIETY
mgnify:CR=1 FL=1